jgi:hypothetical protein
MPPMARRLARRGALALIGFIVARPALDAFLRRQIYRFPGLAGQARAAIARSRRRVGQALPTLATDEAQLSDNARQVLRDLARTFDHHRQP